MHTIQTAVDVSMLSDLKSLLGSKFNQLLEAYLRDSKKRMDKLAAALAAQDYAVIKLEVHGLKGSSQNIGAAKFASTCGLLETEVQRQQGQHLEPLFATMQQQYAAVCRCLNDYL